MAIYMRFDVLGSPMGSGGASAVYGISLGSHAVTPGNLAFMVNSSEAGHRWGEVHGFNYGVIAPRDPQTGNVSGKREHKPIVIVKEIDKASPLFQISCCNNEEFKSLNIHLYTSVNQPKNKPSLTIHLTDASLLGIRPVTHSGSKGKHTGSLDTNELEEISFAFQKIEVSHNDGKVGQTDDWKQ